MISVALSVIVVMELIYHLIVLLGNVLITCILHQWKRLNDTIASLFIFVYNSTKANQLNVP